MSESNLPKTAPANPEVRFEDSDMSVRWLTIAGVILLFLTIGAMIGAVWILGGFASYRAATDPTPLPLLELRPTPPAPRIQPNPIDSTTAEEDLAALRAREEAILTGYGWIDRQTGIVRIPIDQAIELLSEAEEPAR